MKYCSERRLDSPWYLKATISKVGDILPKTAILLEIEKCIIFRLWVEIGFNSRKLLICKILKPSCFITWKKLGSRHKNFTIYVNAKLTPNFISCNIEQETKKVTCKIQTGAGKYVASTCLKDLNDYPELDFHVFLRGTAPCRFKDQFRLWIIPVFQSLSRSHDGVKRVYVI